MLELLEPLALFVSELAGPCVRFAEAIGCFASAVRSADRTLAQTTRFDAYGYYRREEKHFTSEFDNYESLMSAGWSMYSRRGGCYASGVN